MKKLILGSVVLFLFSASGLMLQISCSKETKAEGKPTQNDGLKQLGKILYKSQGDYWLVNYNGTGRQKLNIPLPSGYNGIAELALSPDGEKVFFVAVQEVGPPVYEYFHLYSCNLDGSTLKRVLDNEDVDQLFVY